MHYRAFPHSLLSTSQETIQTARFVGVYMIPEFLNGGAKWILSRRR